MAVEAQWDTAAPAAWDALVSKVPWGAYQQFYAFGEVIRQHGGGVHRAVVKEDGAPIGAAQVITRRIAGVTLATALMGPVWLEGLSEAVLASGYETLRSTLPAKGAFLFLATPPEADDRVERTLRLPRIVSSYHTGRIDLSAGEDARRARLDGKWRNRLVAAEGAGLAISAVGRRPEQYGWLLEEEARQQKSRGYRALPPSLVPAYQEAAGRDAVTTFEARREGERVAGMLFLRHGPFATYHIGWFGEAGRPVNAGNLLLWEAMKHLAQKGVRLLDLGGLDTDHTAGIARFKIGTGARVVSQSGTWLLRPRLR